MKLKVELFRYDTLVFGKILEQDESLRGKEEVISRSDYEIDSVSSPEIRQARLLIRGVKKCDDNKVLYYNFTTVKDAEAWCENIKKLIDKLNHGDEDGEEDDIVRVM